MDILLKSVQLQSMQLCTPDVRRRLGVFPLPCPACLFSICLLAACATLACNGSPGSGLIKSANAFHTLEKQQTICTDISFLITTRHRSNAGSAAGSTMVRLMDSNGANAPAFRCAACMGLRDRGAARPHFFGFPA